MRTSGTSSAKTEAQCHNGFEQDVSVTESRHSIALSFVSELDIFPENHDKRSSCSMGGQSIDSLASSVYSRVSTPTRGLPPFFAGCIVVNYISVGYILLPGAFAQAGIVYSTIVFALVALQSYATAVFLLEACAHAESLLFLDESQRRTLPRRFSIEIRERKFELSNLSRIFLGPRWSSIVSFLTACDLYGITWTFCSIFAATFANEFSMNVSDGGYKIYVTVFVALTLPLSCTSFLDQFALQFIFLTLRMLMVLIMIVTLAVAFANPNDSLFGDQIGPNKGDVNLFDFSETIAIVQTCIFATAFQFSVPGIASVTTNQSGIKWIFGSSVGFIYGSNVALAVLAAMYFGRELIANSNLEWSDFHGGQSGLSRLISGYVTLFAAIDGLAVYPLICVSLGDNLLHAFYGENAHDAEKNWKIRSLFRLVACLPQAVGALFVKDLGVLTKYAGIFTLLSYTAAPSWIYIASSRKMADKQLPRVTVYSNSFFSSDALAYCLLATVVILVVGVAIEPIFK